MCREGEGDPHTLAQGPSVSGSKGLALGMCLASLQGLEGGGDRVPGACGGVWGEICNFPALRQPGSRHCSSRLNILSLISIRGT